MERRQHYEQHIQPTISVLMEEVEGARQHLALMRETLDTQRRLSSCEESTYRRRRQSWRLERISLQQQVQLLTQRLRSRELQVLAAEQRAHLSEQRLHIRQLTAERQALQQQLQRQREAVLLAAQHVESQPAPQLAGVGGSSDDESE